VDSLRGTVPARLDRQRFLRRKKEQEGSALLDLITANAHAVCEKAVDKVWGMHSLAKSCCKTAVRVSYLTPLFLAVSRVLWHDLLTDENGSLQNITMKAQRLKNIFW
jgi:hypothetical protein